MRSYANNGGIIIGISAVSILMTKIIEIAGYGEDADGIVIDDENVKLIGNVVKI